MLHNSSTVWNKYLLFYLGGVKVLQYIRLSKNPDGMIFSTAKNADAPHTQMQYWGDVL